MVSGFLTSPLDHERIDSGDATEIATYSTWLTFSSPSNSRVDSLVFIITILNCEFSAFPLTEICQCLRRIRRLLQRVRITHFHIHPQRLHFLDQHVERLGDARLKAVVTLDNAL